MSNVPGNCAKSVGRSCMDAMYNYYRKIFGKRVLSEREAQGLSYYELTKQSGVATNVIKSIEQGDKDYTFRSLVQVCEALGLKIKIN